MNVMYGIVVVFTWGTDQDVARLFFIDPPHRAASLAPYSGAVIVLLLP